MSRVTPPVTKFARSMGTQALARPSHILNNTSRAVVAVERSLDRKPSPGPEMASRPITTTHRPTAAPSAPRKLPLMQSFRHSAAAPARHDAGRVVLPLMRDLEAQADPFATMRMPLLPDVRARQSGLPRAPEQPDRPLARPEILVVAANPNAVLPAALTEVEGMGVDGVELKFAHELDDYSPRRRAAIDEGAHGGMIRNIWKGLVDDVLGGGSPKPGAA